MSNGKSKSFRRRHILHIAHCSLLIGHLGSAHRRFMKSLHGLSTAHWDHEPLPSKQLAIGNRQSEGSWRGATSKIRTRIGTMNAGFSPQIQGYRRFSFPPICGSPESAGKTSMVHG